MAKKNTESAFKSRPYIIAAVALFIVLTLNMVMLTATYAGTVKVFSQTSAHVSILNSSNAQLMEVNENVLEIVGGIGNINGHVQAITALFNGIRAKLDAYEALENEDELVLRRFHHARAYIEAYDNKMLEYQEELNEISALEGEEQVAALAEFQDRIPDVYEQEIAPLQTAASEMMVAAINMAIASANKSSGSSIRYLFLILTVLAIVLIVSELGIFFFARSTKRSMEEIERKNQQVLDASGKLMRSREKMQDFAATNILTGLKNRYSLEEDLGERLAAEQFNIAAFDMDNFKAINDMYGYDFGDEYLSQVSERLKNEFGQFAEIYNITGNEFVFVFNREVSDTQALRQVEEIAAVMNAPYTIFNLTVQLTVTAAAYHYLAGDCLNVNSLLVKLDNNIRNAKRAGGAQIVQVTDL